MIAKEFGQLPDTIEREMSEWWRSRAWEYMQGDNIAAAKRIAQATKRK